MKLQYVAESRPEFPQRGEPVLGPESIATLFRALVPAKEKREHFVAFYLNGRHVPIRSAIVSVGTLNASLVHPREVLAPALGARAAAFILAHNHPSGDPAPSGEDVAITRRLEECGSMVGVQLLDHVIVGAGSAFVSLRERGVLKG
jgi:DNA repair protein RadC